MSVLVVGGRWRPAGVIGAAFLTIAGAAGRGHSKDGVSRGIGRCHRHGCRRGERSDTTKLLAPRFYPACQATRA